MGQSRLVVRPHDPVRATLFWAVLIMGIALSGYGVYEFGHYRSGHDLKNAEAKTEILTARVAELEKERSELRGRLALLETSSEIDREAYSEVEGALVELQTMVQEQREELAFYKGIVAAGDERGGLHIQDFRIETMDRERVYRINLVLTRRMKHDRRVTGVVDMTVRGTHNGKPIAYKVADLAIAQQNMEFGFRYFQEFENDIRLPEGFSPKKVEVNVDPKGRGLESVNESFEWTVAG